MPVIPPSPSQSGRSGKRWYFVGALIVLLVFLFAVNHLHPDAEVGKKMEKPGTAKHPAPVTLAVAVQNDVPIQRQVIGNVQSFSAVSIKPQVNGKILDIHFHEGQFVKAGDLLFTIDPQPFVAALNQAQATVGKDYALINEAKQTLARDKTMVQQAHANLKRDVAQETYAKAEEQRYSQLLQAEYVSKEQYEQYRTNARSLSGTVSADRAAIRTSEATLGQDIAAIQSAQETLRGDQAVVQSNRINLNYCYVRAPFSGRTGSYQVHPGDAVQANITNLVNLDQINPTYVTFAIPEQELPTIKKGQTSGELQVAAVLDDPSHSRFHGRITFFDNAVDMTTGTIQLKGTFENPTGQLWPGQFVTVVLSLGHIPNAVVVPPQAVMTGQKGDYVFVDNAGVAELRPVTVARTTDTWAAISQGLQPGEKVVTDGQLSLEPGFHLKVKQNRRKHA